MGLGKLVKGVGKLAAKGVGGMIPFRGGGAPKIPGVGSMMMSRPGMGAGMSLGQAPSPPPNPNLPPQPDIATGGAQMMAPPMPPQAPPGMMPQVMPQQNQDQMNILQRLLAGNPGGYGGMR